MDDTLTKSPLGTKLIHLCITRSETTKHCGLWIWCSVKLTAHLWRISAPNTELQTNQASRLNFKFIGNVKYEDMNKMIPQENKQVQNVGIL